MYYLLIKNYKNAPGGARTHDLRMSCTAYKYDALTNYATGADNMWSNLHYMPNLFRQYNLCRFA